MKKILFVATELFGTRAGSFRQERWVKEFLIQGFTCYVFDNLSFNGKFQEFKTLDEFIQFRENVRANANSAPSIKEGKLINVLRTLKHFFLWEVFSPFNILHTGIILVKMKFNKVDIVFSSTPPFSAAVIGFFIKLLYPQSKFVLDFRDEWANHPFLPNITIINRKTIEQIIVSKTDKLLTVSNFIKSRIEDRHNVNVDLIYNAPDILYKEGEQKFECEFKVIRILYTGSLPNSSFNIEILHKWLVNINNRVGNKFFFEFVGACNNLRKLGEINNTIFRPHTTLSEIRTIQNSSDILLFLGANFPDNGGIVSAKIFEYLQSGKPILPLFVYPNSDVYKIIEGACGFCLSIFDEDTLIEILNTINNEKQFTHIPKLVNKSFMADLLFQYSKCSMQIINTLNEK